MHIICLMFKVQYVGSNPTSIFSPPTPLFTLFLTKFVCSLYIYTSTFKYFIVLPVCTCTWGHFLIYQIKDGYFHRTHIPEENRLSVFQQPSITSDRDGASWAPPQSSLGIRLPWSCVNTLCTVPADVYSYLKLWCHVWQTLLCFKHLQW